MTKQTRLELTWIGKEEKFNLEPRILLEDQELSYHADEKFSDNDIFDNRLIFGDNLLALKALEEEFTGAVKCIFIDPPYNTGNAFEQYDDGLEHSMWLSLMKERLILLRRLLSDQGSIWISIDDNEAHYLKVLCDEIFGRNCFISTVIWRTTDNSKNNVTTFSLDHNYILVYAKKTDWKPKFLNDPTKRKHFKNPDNDPKGPWFDGNPVNNPALRPNLQFDIEGPNGNIIKHPPNGWRWSKETMQEKFKTGELRFSEDGKRVIRRTYLKDLKGLPPSTLWTDLNETGHNRQAKYELKSLFPEVKVTDLFSTPKPEKLIKKILELSTDPYDLVLDSFAGSGTTGAVAHKMKRRWMMIELGEHCYSTIIPRMQKVIDGTDEGGISSSVNWHGGGGFRFYRLAPSLLQKDKYGKWIISTEYNPEMLAEAMCKFEGFKYNPNNTVFWKHGQSTENDFIYVTTQFINQQIASDISDQMKDDETLLICCKAFNINQEEFPNITFKKIPQMVLNKCEFGRDDYSLNISQLPSKKKEPEQMDLFEGSDEE